MSDRSRRRLLQAAGLLGMGFQGTRAAACEFWTANLRVLHPWTRATADDATTATVCMRFDQVAEDDRLLGVTCMVASGAELVGPAAGDGRIDIAIPKGAETVLGEHGTQLRLTGLLQPLEVGRAYPMQLRFERGGVLRADLTVDFARFN